MKQFEQERRVVIVDDSRTIQAYLEIAFGNRRDFRVVGFAADAKSAVDLIRRLVPDIVTIDLNMPYLDGEALLGMIRDCHTVCKIIVSDIAAENRMLSTRLVHSGAAACLGKSDLVRNPDYFFDTIKKAFETVYQNNRRIAGARRRSGHGLTYPVPVDDDERIRICAKKSLLNARREPHFDMVTQHAAKLTGFPIGLLTFLDRDTQWIKSAYGLSVESTPREVAFCNYTIVQGGPFVVGDATSDGRFADNPLVTGAPNIRAYTGLPITNSDNFVVGALCVIDKNVRTVSKYALDQLSALAEITSSIVALRSPLTN